MRTFGTPSGHSWEAIARCAGALDGVADEAVMDAQQRAETLGAESRE
jgi:hypothetical protein